jgi:hypothetical protein
MREGKYHILSHIISNPVMMICCESSSRLELASQNTKQLKIELPGEEIGLGIHLHDFVFKLLDINTSRIAGPFGRKPIFNQSNSLWMIKTDKPSELSAKEYTISTQLDQTCFTSSGAS